MSAPAEGPSCRTCGQPIHPDSGTSTGWKHYPDLPVWCDDKAPAPKGEDPVAALRVAAKVDWGTQTAGRPLRQTRQRPGHETPLSGPELHAIAKGWARLSEQSQQRWVERARRSMSHTAAADSGQAEYMADRIRRHLRKNQH